MQQRLLIAVALIWLFALTSVHCSSKFGEWRNSLPNDALLKFDRFVLDRIEAQFVNQQRSHESIPVLIKLRHRPLREEYTHHNIDEQAHRLVNALRSIAERTQRPIIEALTHQWRVAHRPLWIVNSIALRSNYTLLHWLSQHQDIAAIEPNFSFKAQLAVRSPHELESVTSSNHTNAHGKRDSRSGSGVEWNLSYVYAPDVWLQGFTGQGIVVANADTGINWNHPALINQYRSIDGTPSRHDYNWWDSIHSGHSTCGIDLKEPCDDNGHGTHTTGTAVGDDGQGNQIGMAPGAKWMGCRNMGSGDGTPSSYIECLQFFISPTNLQGQNSRTELRPHVISNSYGCPPKEGCQPESLHDAIANVRNAGIFMAVSAGNTGPGCHSIDDPPAIDENVMTIAATGYRTDMIAAYSSRGPVTIDSSYRQKPDISAPGSTVRSCLPGGYYTAMSGTSMACPHIAGAVALLWSARPEFVRNIEATENVLRSSARTLTSSNNCNSKRSTTFSSNNVYGAGLLDIKRAVAWRG